MLSPLRLGLRLVIASVLVLGCAHFAQRSLLQSLAPLIKSVVEVVQGEFHVVSLDAATKGHNQTLQLTAVLTQPIQIKGQWIYPEAWLGAPLAAQQVSGMQVDLTAGGTLSYSLLVLIVALAWPVSKGLWLLRRMAWALVFSGLLLVVNAATTFPAELWALFHDALAPQDTWLLLVWSRMLMGGVGLMLALGFGVLAVIFGGGAFRASRLPE